MGKTLEIYYSEEGECLPDMKVMDWAKKLVEDFNSTDCHDQVYKVCVSGALMVDALRLLIAKGTLDHERVVFKYEDKLIKPNRYGYLESWPKGFCDHSCDILEELLFKAAELRKRLKGEKK